MSAYQVDRAHVATLAVFGARDVAQRFGGLVGLANLLAAGNVESLRARYPQDDWTAHVFADDAEVYGAAREELTGNPLVMLKAVACLDYQSCEHDGWKASDACLACDWLRSAAIRRLPGYDDCPGWSIADRAPGEKPGAVSLMGLAARSRWRKP